MAGLRAIFQVVMALAAVGFASPALARLSFERVQLDSGAVLLVSGRFDYSDSLQGFEALLRDGDIGVVTFNSPGGNVYKAMELGRAIRRNGLATFQIRASECASACALAFFGGVHRLAEAGSLGMHRSSFSDVSGLAVDDAVASIQALTADIILYMGEMGIDPALLQLALQYDADDIRYLSRSEMERYRVTTGGEDVATASPPTSLSRPARPVASSSQRFAIPEARSGMVQFPKGSIELKLAPDPDSASVGRVTNGAAVKILSTDGAWYRIRAGGRSGYAHGSWIKVDQFAAALVGKRRIQIRSVRTFAEARAFTEASRVPATAFLASNGWFAIALAETFVRKEQGERRLKALKMSGLIPRDSILTFGNTYVRAVCCD